MPDRTPYGVASGLWTICTLAWATGAVTWVGGCATGSPAPPTHVTAEDWSELGLSGRRYHTQHFTLITTPVDEEFERALPQFAEAVYRRCAQIVRPDGTLADNTGAGRMIVYVFGSRTEWDYFTRRRFAARYSTYVRIQYGGFTEGGTSVSFYTNRTATLATLAHEIWHQYAATHVRAQLPAWLNEGLACYVESLQFVGDKPKFTPRRNSFRINSLCDAIQRDALIPLSQLVRTNAGTLVGHGSMRQSQVYYAQVWALITFFRHGAGGRHGAAFGRLLDDMANETFDTRTSAARLGLAATGVDSWGSAVLVAYFGSPESLQEGYYDHLIRTCGF